MTTRFRLLRLRNYVGPAVNVPTRVYAGLMQLDVCTPTDEVLVAVVDLLVIVYLSCYRS